MSDNQPDSQLLLYDYPISYNCQIVRLVLCEKDIPGRTKRVDIGPMMEQFEPWFVEINPEATVPVVDHDGRRITDTLEIVRYLDERFPGPDLTPDNESDRAAMEEWIALERGFPEGDFTYGLVEQGTGKIVAKDMERRKMLLNGHMAENPELATAYQAKIDEVTAWQKRLSNDDLVDKLIERLQEALDKLEKHIEGREYIVGDGYTLADSFWTAFLGRLEMLGFKRLWSFGRRPHIENYYIGMKRRPSFHCAPIHLKSSLGLVLASAIRAFWPRILMVLGVVAAVIIALAIFL
jgi:glutathione S-transferase